MIDISREPNVTYESKKIVILGTGGNCVDVLDTINEINLKHNKIIYECIGFLDDNKEIWGRNIQGVKVLGGLDLIDDLNDFYFVFGIGSVRNHTIRNTIREKLKISDDRFETIIHPSATVSKFSKIGKGVIILQNVTVASNAQIDNFVVILPNSIISHDCVISAFTLITGGVCISGNVNIGRNCYLGTGSLLRDGISVGDRSLLGMGSVLVKSIPQDSRVFGNPAK
jgi:sugar O-acyltransferase (sialic acid O-acetyltransferase NeuD family)